MEVKDIRSSSFPSDIATEDAESLKPQRGKSDEAAPVTIDNGSERSPSATDLRVKANQIVSVINLAADATDEIRGLVRSIGGILEQAKGDGVSDQRRSILEKEANELVDEIKKTAQSTEAGGIKPLAGDKIRLEIEEKLGKTLEIILPEDATEAFGLGKIRLSTKDTIINTIAHVANAEARLDELRKAVDKGAGDVRSAVTQLEVAHQNNEASQVSLRDVDEALKLATDTGAVIGSDPARALGSVGHFRANALDLLD